MRVRLYKKSDIKSVLALYNQFNRTSLTSKQFAKLITATKGRDFIFCGIIDDLIVGYLILKVDMDVEYAGMRAEFTDFFVKLKYRGRGLGRKLMTTATVFAKKKGAKRIFLLVDSGPSRAKRLYRDLGFKKMRDTVVFEKDI